MGHAHTDERARIKASPRVRLILGLILAPLLLATVIGLVSLWPNQGDIPGRQPMLADGGHMVSATVLAVNPEDATISVLVQDAPAGVPQLGQAYVPPEFFADGISVDDHVRLMFIPDIVSLPGGADAPFIITDYERTVPMVWLFLLYAFVVILVARWRGLASIIGLGIALWLVLNFTLPALLVGAPAGLVALTTASAAMLPLLYLAHGFNARATTALLGTYAGLLITIVVAIWATATSNLALIGSEDALYLPSHAPLVDLRGILLCGIILAGLGVLNDVTITQASAIWELKAADAALTRWELFRRGMRIGRDHIASTVYTIAFAYVGSSLLLLLVVSTMDRSVIDTLTSGEIAEEIVRTLVGSIGLVLAIPLTTGIAAAVVSAGENGDPAVQHVNDIAPVPVQQSGMMEADPGRLEPDRLGASSLSGGPHG